MTFKEENIKEMTAFNEQFKWYLNPPSYFNKPIKVRIGLNEQEQLLIDEAKLNMIKDINKLLSHKIINVNKDELNSILDCKSFFECNNTLCIQIDKNGSYWIKFDDKGGNK